MNTEGITNHHCDFCGKDCVGEFYKIGKRVHRYCYKDMCFECYHKNVVSDTDYILDTPIYGNEIVMPYRNAINDISLNKFDTFILE